MLICPVRQALEDVAARQCTQEAIQRVCIATRCGRERRGALRFVPKHIGNTRFNDDVQHAGQPTPQPIKHRARVWTHERGQIERDIEHLCHSDTPFVLRSDPEK
jgi:hypothetical protein